MSFRRFILQFFNDSSWMIHGVIRFGNPTEIIFRINNISYLQRRYWYFFFQYLLPDNVPWGEIPILKVSWGKCFTNIFKVRFGVAFIFTNYNYLLYLALFFLSQPFNFFISFKHCHLCRGFTHLTYSFILDLSEELLDFFRLSSPLLHTLIYVTFILATMIVPVHSYLKLMNVMLMNFIKAFHQ